MNLTFQEFHVYACSKTNQSSIMLEQVKKNDRDERMGDVYFSQENFENCLARGISIYMPYYDPTDIEHRKIANVYALSICNHRIKEHSEEIRNDEKEIYERFIQDTWEERAVLNSKGMDAEPAQEEILTMSVQVWWEG